MLYISCSTNVQNNLSVLEISVQASFRANGAIHVYFVHNFILNNFCSITLYKIFDVFEILEGKYLRFAPLKSLVT